MEQPPLHSSYTPRRWLVMVHQLPSEPSNLRVRVWREMRQLGAISLKQAVYVLPESASAREALQRQSLGIKEAGGDATVFAAESLDAQSDESLVEAFRRARQDAYRALERDLERTLRLVRGRRARPALPLLAPERVLQRFRERVTAAERLDYFAASGRDRVVARLEQLAAALSTPPATREGPVGGDQMADRYRGRVWVTRPRPGVDRMASAWLIRRFIDPGAAFAFATDRHAVPAGAIPFDMSEVEFSHHGGGCTFETLCDRFSIRDRAVGRLAAIVHDLDLKDDRFGAPEALTIGAVVQGLQLAHTADAILLEHGMALFEALYRSPTRRGTQAASELTRRNAL
jgi:hypothetical protein